MTNAVANRRVTCKPQSWTLQEKFDVVITILSDARFTYAEKVVAGIMITYFHNTTSGDLFPSRQQVVQRCGAKKDIVISATRKMECFGYLNVDKSNGGRCRRNTYHLKKRSEKVTVLETETVQKKDWGSPQNGLAGVQKTDSHISREYIQRIYPGKGKRLRLASASQGRGCGVAEKKWFSWRER
jgi:hypothetical protein